MARKPLALANWKMAMTVAEGLAFLNTFQALAGDWLGSVETVICPPATALWALAQALLGARIGLGGQNMTVSTEVARTGELSAALLADVGCRWVMLGHWEVRRHLGDDDATVNRKLHLALQAGLAPILLVGEAQEEPAALSLVLPGRLARLLAGCGADQVARTVVVYEPEGAIGAAAPTALDHVAAGCGIIRQWLAGEWGRAAAEAVRIIYGGSVVPEAAAGLLACPDLDGLGAGRQGRDAAGFAAIVRRIAEAKGGVAARRF